VVFFKESRHGSESDSTHAMINVYRFFLQDLLVIYLGFFSGWLVGLMCYEEQDGGEQAWNFIGERCPDADLRTPAFAPHFFRS